MNFISYPGLSAELVIDKNFTCNHFFELVSSCGIFCRMPDHMQTRLLNSINSRGIIFVTDSANQQKLAKTLRNDLKKVEFAKFEVIAKYNSYGLRVNESVFTDSEKFRNLIKHHPGYLVLVSTPYSCPDLSQCITNADTLANRSSLFFFENKRIYSKKFNHELNYIAEFGPGDFEKLSEFFDNPKEHETYFLKPLGNYVGGTTTLPINRDSFKANQAMIKNLLSSETYYLFKYIDALNVTSQKGEHHGTQFRPFISNSGELVGFAVKFSAQAVGKGGIQTSLKRLNATYNSSSGTAISILFECSDKVAQATRLALSKTESTDNKAIIKTFLDDLKFGSLSFNNEPDVRKIAGILKPKMDDLQSYFNNFFFEQEWSTLYKRFITDKIYFDGN